MQAANWSRRSNGEKTMGYSIWDREKGSLASSKRYVSYSAALKACGRMNDKDYPANVDRFYVKKL